MYTDQGIKKMMLKDFSLMTIRFVKGLVRMQYVLFKYNFSVIPNTSWIFSSKIKQEIYFDVHVSLDLKYLSLYKAKAICLKIHFSYLLR